MAGRNETGLRLRPATDEDCRRLFEWVNDPVSREWSLSRAEISWNEHKLWFSAALEDPACRIYLAVEHGGEPVGQIRFELDGSREAVVSVSVAPRCRGRGLGGRIIALGLAAVTAESAVAGLHAFIVRGNHASRGAFERSGFVYREAVTVRGRDCDHYYWQHG